VCLGGRAAEEVILDSMTSGASNDLEQANTIARTMVERLGMCGDDHLLIIKDGEVSPERKNRVENEVEKILKLCMAKARDIVKDNRKLHKAFLKALMKKNVLKKEELNEIAKKLGYTIEKLEITTTVEEEKDV